MKVFQIVVLLAVLTGSILSFFLGHYWENLGWQMRDCYPVPSEVNSLAKAIASLGLVMECSGVVGVLVSFAFFGMTLSIKKCESRMRRLEEELAWIRQALPTISFSMKCSESSEIKGSSL